MSYSASALSFMLENFETCNFTGSQLPIGDLRTDAKENLITAIQIALFENGPVISEVGLYFEYKLYRGTERPRLMHFKACLIIHN
jgi:L-asparaginase